MKTRYKGIKKQQWYSICSQHREYDINCPTCNKGSWHNILMVMFGQVVYTISPKLWRWYINY